MIDLMSSDRTRSPDLEASPFVVLYKECQRKIHGYVLALAPHLDPEKVTEETFDQIYQKWDTLADENPTMWAIRFARALVFDENNKLRRERTDELIERRLPSSTAPWSTPEQRQELRETLEAIAALTLNQREALILETVGFTRDQIAEAMDVTPKTVAEYIKTGRAEFRQQVKTNARRQRRNRRRRGSVNERRGD